MPAETETARKAEQVVSIEERAARTLAKTGTLCLECLSLTGERPLRDAAGEIIGWYPCPVCRPGENHHAH